MINPELNERRNFLELKRIGQPGCKFFGKCLSLPDKTGRMIGKLKIYNSLTRQKEEFQPLHPPHVGMYEPFSALTWYIVIYNLLATKCDMYVISPM